MPAPVDWTLWLLTTFVEAFVVYLFLIQGLFRKFLLFNCYLIFSVAVEIGRCVLLSRFGLISVEYNYFYYFTETFLAVGLFIAIGELSARLVGTKMPRTRVIFLSAIAFLAVVWSSLAVVWNGGGRSGIHFAVELSQNIFFVCCLATVLLWIWRLRNDPEDWVAARFVGVLSVYFSLLLLIFGVRHIAPHASDVYKIYPMVSAWLPLGCGFALVSHERQ
jgi:hypothetical protein